EDEAARQREVAALLAPRRTIVQDLPVERIKPNPFQARHDFSGVEELAQAIGTQGFTSRLRVRPDPDQPGFFQLVYGERRLRAARIAGLTEIPCEVADHTDDELIEIGLAENIQRRDLAPLEEAQAFRTLIDGRGYSIRRLAERLGKDKSYVEDRLKLLQAPEDVQQMVEQRPDTLRAAREIARIDTPDARAPLIAGVIQGDINTEDVRAIVRETAASAPKQHARDAETSEAKDVRRIVERDARTMRAILERWGTLADQGDDARALVSEQTEALLREMQRLVEALEC
ncbi:MAG TPA: ParB/RepB/Spo0J family partition protein, partial [Roseiflexaceae bacterium]